MNDWVKGCTSEKIRGIIIQLEHKKRREYLSIHLVNSCLLCVELGMWGIRAPLWEACPHPLGFSEGHLQLWWAVARPSEDLLPQASGSGCQGMCSGHGRPPACAACRPEALGVKRSWK